MNFNFFNVANVTSLFVFILSHSAFSATSLQSLSCEWIKPIQNAYLDNHITYVINKNDTKLQDRVIDTYIRQLDLKKFYFIEADVQSLKLSLSDLFKRVNRKDCSYLSETNSILIKRVDERMSFLDAALKTDLLIDQNFRKNFVRGQVSWPVSKREAEIALLNDLKIQVANRISAGQSLSVAQETVFKSLKKFQQQVRHRSAEELVRIYLNGYARALDPRSAFLQSSYYAEPEKIELPVKEGIGITLFDEEGFVQISSIIPGGSASESNILRPMDRIISILDSNGKMQNVIDRTADEVAKMLQGVSGTSVRIKVLRIELNGSIVIFEHDFVRKRVHEEAQKPKIFFVDRESGRRKLTFAVIQVPYFYGDPKRGYLSSSDDIENLIRLAVKKSVQGIVLDLSENASSRIKEAVRTVGFFVPSGNVARQSSPLGRKDEYFVNENTTVLWRGPLVVLTSSKTSLAGELAAGSLKDFRRALIIGNRTTSGNGSLQTVVPIPTEVGALRVTFGLLFTPAGNSFQYQGVPSDIILDTKDSADVLSEKDLEFSILPQKMDSFFSKDPETQIKPEWKDRLQKSSKIRSLKAANGETYLKRFEIQESVSILNDLIELQTEQKN